MCSNRLVQEHRDHLCMDILNSPKYGLRNTSILSQEVQIQLPKEPKGVNTISNVTMFDCCSSSKYSFVCIVNTV